MMGATAPTSDSTLMCAEQQEAGGSKGKVRVLRSLAEIEGVRVLWTSWQRHPNSDLDSYLITLGSRPEILRPHILLVYRGDQPSAMLIGRVEDRQIAFRLGYRVVFKPRVRQMTFIYAGLLGNPSAPDCDLLVRAIRTSLKDGEADLALLSHLDAQSPLYELAGRIPGPWTRDLFPTPAPHWGMTLPESIELVYRRMSEHQRSEIRRKARKLIAQHRGQVTIHSWHEPCEVERLVKEVEAVAKKAYQRGLGVGFADNGEMRRRLAFEAERGWLRGFVLMIADSPAAYWIGSQYDHTFHGKYTGYDPGWAKYSPGMFLTMQVIEEMCHATGQGRVREIDFGFGDAPYKRLLGNAERKEASIYIFAPTLKGVRLNATRRAVLTADRSIRRGFQALGLLAKVKRIWRSGLIPESPQAGNTEHA